MHAPSDPRLPVPRVARRGLLAGLAALSCALPAMAADRCLGHVTDREPRVVARMARPAYLKTYRDPAFDSRVTRISDTPSGQIVKTLYSTVQAWNADESRLILYHTGGTEAGHHLYDGRSYRHLAQLPFSASDIEELFWDPERANILYFVQRSPEEQAYQGKLVSYDIDTGRKAVVADVSEACGTSGTGVLPTAGADVQGLSGDLLGIRCDLPAADGGPDDRTFVVDVRTGGISANRWIGPTRAIGGDTGGSLPDIAMTSLPGSGRLLLQGSVFDARMRFQHRVDMPLRLNAEGRSVPHPEHDSIGRLSNGHDALFTPQFNPGPAGCPVGTLVAHDLQNRDCHVLIGPDNGWSYPQSGIHHSALTTGAQGWIATSTIGYGQLEYLSNGAPAPVLFSEIVLTSNDPDEPDTCRLAHIRTHGKSARRTARQAYFGEPHPVISPSGTRVLFSSDWYDSGTVDTFVIDVGGSVPASAPTSAPTSTPTSTPTSPPATPSTAPAPTPSTSSATLEPEQRRYAVDAERIAVRFSDPTGGDFDRVTIAPAGSPDAQLRMWLYTNGTQRPSRTSPRTGRLLFLTQYIGTGDFEARLFRKNSDEIVARETFRIER